MAAKLIADSMGEELRVLYVAMTRAKEKLILCGSCKPEKAAENGSNPETANARASVRQDGTAAAYHVLPAMSPSRILEASSFFDLLLPVWQAAGREVQFLSTEDFLAEELMQTASARNARQRLEFAVQAQQDSSENEEYRSLKQRLARRYPHENLAGLFVKTTVSELKKAGMQEAEEAGAELYPEEEIVPYLPRFVREEEEEVSGSTRGSAYHRFLQLFPYKEKETAEAWSIAEIKKTILQKQQTGEFSEEFAAVINPKKIRIFLQSKLAERMRKAEAENSLKREQPFVLGIGADSMHCGLPAEETVLIQGIIDAFFEEDGGLVVVDYKTDKVSEAAELVRRYQVQLDYYTQALERLTGKKVKERIIYSFALGREILL